MRLRDSRLATEVIPDDRRRSEGTPVDNNEALRTLTERRDWLTARIAAKQSVGWEVLYDTRERDALAWALEHWPE